MLQPRAKIRRHPERAVPEAAAAILREALVAHIGIVQDGQPFVLPFTFLYRDGKVYLHGSPGSRTVRALARGEPACVEVTLVDGLIASKSAETHSVNYRSVVLFGSGRAITDDALRIPLLEELVGRYFAGRTAGVDYAHLTPDELNAVTLVELDVEELSAKARDGGPRGPFDDDPDYPGNAGVLPTGPAGLG